VLVPTARLIIAERWRARRSDTVVATRACRARLSHFRAARTGGSCPESGMSLAIGHARIAHALDVLDEVQQRRDEPQVARHGRLAPAA
jgi:hypothetical protein